MRNLAIGIVLLSISCGGSKTQPTTPEGTSTTTKSSASAASDDDDELSPETKAAVAAASASPPVTAADGSIVLELLLKPGASASEFPKATAKDADCNKGLGFAGESKKDYDMLLGKCGGPTGLKEYVKTVTGKLDAKHLRDVYTFKMVGGYCYRFFAVADDTVSNLDIRVQRPEGALVSIAASKNFVAIMNPDRVWCKTHDREFRLVVETSAGKGNYTFGVWARPKP